MSLKIRNIFLLFGVILGVFITLTLIENSYPNLDLSLRQFLIYPFFLAFIYLVTKQIQEIPRVILLVSILAAVAGFIAARKAHNVSLSPYLVARLGDDQFENESRIFRASINSAMVEENTAKASRYHGQIANQQDAFKLLKNDSDKVGVVWGSKRWLSISFNFKNPETLGRLGIRPEYSSLYDFELVRYVPVVGLSYNPINETALYIASLMDALAALGSEHQDDVNWDRAILKFRAAGAVFARWSSLAHRAYPWWQVGNLSLLQALQETDYQAGTINCAINAYRYAARQLSYGDNPELLAAISNNLGLAYMAKLAIEAKVEYRKLARKKFKVAINIAGRPNRYGIRFRASKSATENLRILKKQFKAKKLKQKAKRKRKNYELRSSEFTN